MYKQTLQNIGLTKSEAEAYEVLLRIGPSPISNILKEVKLKRPNTYAVLHALAHKHLVVEKRRNKKTIYEAEPPERLEQILNERLTDLQKTKSDIEKTLPELKSLYVASTERPVVQFFYGLMGLEKVYADILKSRPPELLIFASVFSRQVPGFSALVEKQIQLQKKLSIKARALRGSLGPEIDRQHILKDRAAGISRRVLPKGEFNLPGQIIIYQDKVAITALKSDLITTWLENPDIAQTFRVIFEQLWSLAGP